MVLGVETKYHVIFECAWSQPEDDLTEKINNYFTREDISAGVSLCIRPAGKYERPKNSAPSGYQIIPAAVVEAGRAFLSPVIIDGHTWGPEINVISLTIYCRGGQPQVFGSLSSSRPLYPTDLTHFRKISALSQGSLPMTRSRCITKSTKSFLTCSARL